MNKERGKNLIEKRNLPNSKLFVDTIRKRFTIKELVEKTGIKSTTIDHWFTYPESSHGFAFPTKEQWALVETEMFPELLKVYYETDEIGKKTPLIGYTYKELQEITKKQAGWDRWAKKYNLGIGGKREAPQEIQQNQNYIPLNILGRNKRTVWEINEIIRIAPEELQEIIIQWFKEHQDIETVWKIPTKPNPEAHFATFPPDLVKPMIKAGCPKPGIVLDPFAGVGTTLKEAWKLGRNYIGFEISKEYCEIATKLLDPTKNYRLTDFMKIKITDKLIEKIEKDLKEEYTI